MKYSKAVLAAIFLSIFLSAYIHAQNTGGDSKLLEEHLDPIAADLMKRLYAPGMAITVVRDGKVILSKGYGFANVETKRPVDPATTVFRIGSITKVFTANAALQLVDDGKLDLDSDVGSYLVSLKIRKDHQQKITIRHLLSHTSGLDEFSAGRRAASPDGVKPLAEFLSDRLVARTLPGKRISYSTYGITLAGHIVEKISGRHLAVFFQDNIFGPLEMTRTNLGPVPAERIGDLAVGYTFNGQYNVQDFEYFHTYPASDINSTANDMARFILAHLENGRYKDRRFLSEESAKLMHKAQFTNHPKLPGWALGFYETRDNNLNGVEHGGSMEGYAALLYLLPEKKLGIFVASNIEQGALMAGMKNAVLDYFYPVGSTPEDRKQFEALKKFAGEYRWDVYCHTCSAETRGFYPRPFTVTVNNDGTLGFLNRRWKIVEPMVFKAILNDDREIFSVFEEDEDGRITFLFNGSNAYERVRD
ncbi:MAG: beta-lactamase family protein [Acidobacteriota bacterium]|nr:MAG: beta-lactamase family protein [Acidobacteriota bacterium]